MAVRWITVILMAVGLVVGSLKADDKVFQLEVGLATFHPFHRSAPYNEDNQFIGVQVGNIQFATFLNSYHGWMINGEEFDGRSFAVGYSYPFNDNFSLDVGLINGYGDAIKYDMSRAISVSGNVLYIAPSLTVWGEDLGKLGVGHPWLDNLGIKFRAFGIVPVVSFVIKF